MASHEPIAPSLRAFCTLPGEILVQVLDKCDDRSLDIFFVVIVPALLLDSKDWQAHQLIKDVGICCFNRHPTWKMRGKKRIGLLYRRLTENRWCAFCGSNRKIVSLGGKVQRKDFFPLGTCMTCLEYGPPGKPRWEHMRAMGANELRKILGWMSTDLLSDIIPTVFEWVGNDWQPVFIVQRYGENFIKGLDRQSVAAHVALLCNQRGDPLLVV